MTVETELLFGFKTFTKDTEVSLHESGISIISSKKRSLFDFERQGYRFVTFPQFLKNKEKVFSEKARSSEIAYVQTGIYLPDSYRHSSYDEQKELLLDYETRLKKLGIKDIKVIFPSVADCMEIADIEKNKGNNIFGHYYGYIYSRTSSSCDKDSSIIIGCDDSDSPEGDAIGEFRGIHIQDYPLDNNMHSALNLMPIIIPA